MPPPHPGHSTGTMQACHKKVAVSSRKTTEAVTTMNTTPTIMDTSTRSVSTSARPGRVAGAGRTSSTWSAAHRPRCGRSGSRWAGR